MGVIDILSVVLLSVAAGLLAEGISWALVYRTSEYKSVVKDLDGFNKRLEKQKETAAAAAATVRNKRADRLEDRVRELNQRLSTMQFKSTFAVMFVMIGCFSLLSSLFDGVIVGKIPFEPFSMISALSHRGLPGTDFTDASAYFVYTLCSLSFRPSLQRLLGVKTAQRGDMFSAFMPKEAK